MNVCINCPLLKMEKIAEAKERVNNLNYATLLFEVNLFVQLC